MTRYRQAVFPAALCMLLATTAAAQQLNEYTLASAYSDYLIQQFGTVEQTEASLVGQSVFADLTRTLSISYGPKPYELTVLGNPSLNAESVGAGKLFVNLGFVSRLGESRGLWAALLGHELAHDVLGHAYRNYVLALSMQQTQANLQQAQDQSRSTTEAIIIALAETGSQLLNLKVRRDEENQADRAGMFIMARAGYHPDFALQLNRILTQSEGDSTKFAAFFQDHPRMATRALRELKEYDQAEEEFSRLWPDASQSPGGVPPPVAIITSVHSSQEKPGKTLLLSAEIEVHNVEASKLIALAAFQDHGRFVHSEDRDHSVQGMLAAQGTLTQTGPRAFTWASRVPTSALPGGHRKLKSWVSVAFDDGMHTEILDISSPIDVEFPK